MVQKEFTYKGKTEQEVKALSHAQFAEIVPSGLRRKIKRGFTEEEKKLIKKVQKGESNIETHCRDMIILPEMFGKTIKVFNGKEFVAVNVSFQMVGHVLGEFALTRKSTAHSAPGVGATRSSAALSVR